MYNRFEMSKWNKAAPVLSDEFLENQERRKQMIIEAAKRRKEKERKLQEEAEEKRKQEAEALIRHKQEKKHAYIKYLRSNMHDKYEDAKRHKKEQEAEIKPTAKWKKRSNEKEDKEDREEEREQEQKEEEKQLEALDLEVGEFKEEKQPAKHRQQLAEEFEREWQMQVETKEELLSSQLLDSLDLDIGTLNRDLHKKVVQRQPPKEQATEVDALRDLIGYESVVINHKPTTIDKPKPPPQPVAKPKPQKEVSEVQVFNELRHKKAAKILEWAIEEQQEAEDLFSNCSSKKKITPTALREVNDQPSKTNPTGFRKKEQLQTISEVKPTKEAVKKPPTKAPLPPPPQPPPAPSTEPKQSSRSKEKPAEVVGVNRIVDRRSSTTTSAQQFPKRDEPRKEEKKQARTGGFGSSVEKARPRANSQEKKQVDREKLEKEKLEKEKEKEKEKQREREKSKEKRENRVASKPQAGKRIFGNLPPLPVNRGETNSIATHDMQMDVESFIKQDLLNLNEQQRQLQEELRQIHQQNRNGIRQTYAKYEIRSDYRPSSDLTGQPSAPVKQPSEDTLEESIQNLDNLLIRQELGSRDRAIREAPLEESQSLINPFSNSEDLCNQVLKLAKNVSRFERKPEVEDKEGYGFMNRAKRNTSGSKQGSRKGKDEREERERQREEEELAESREESQMMQPLSRPPFIFEVSEISGKYDREEPPREKIHVNAKLLKGLLLDD